MLSAAPPPKKQPPTDNTAAHIQNYHQGRHTSAANTQHRMMHAAAHLRKHHQRATAALPAICSNPISPVACKTKTKQKNAYIPRTRLKSNASFLFFAPAALPPAPSHLISPAIKNASKQLQNSHIFNTSYLDQNKIIT